MQRPLASRPPITRHTRDLTNQLAVVEAELVKASRLASAHGAESPAYGETGAVRDLTHALGKAAAALRKAHAAAARMEARGSRGG